MIAVCGSINIDVTAYCRMLPKPGETVHGHRYLTGLGGKGANQAAAAARLGHPTSFIGRVGTDRFGEEALARLGEFGVDLRYVAKDPASLTGIAVINVADGGENAITVIGGANMAMDAGDVAAAGDALDTARVLLLQLEIPVPASFAAAARAKARGATIVLDPAPAADDLPGELFGLVDILTPNESETETLTGIHPHDEASARRSRAGPARTGHRRRRREDGFQGRLREPPGPIGPPARLCGRNRGYRCRWRLLQWRPGLRPGREQAPFRRRSLRQRRRRPVHDPPRRCICRTLFA